MSSLVHNGFLFFVSLLSPIHLSPHFYQNDTALALNWSWAFTRDKTLYRHPLLNYLRAISLLQAMVNGQYLSKVGGKTPLFARISHQHALRTKVIGTQIEWVALL
ncbi:MAG: hypothetical protein BYD32DRAFT_416627 [Podila humilis]|nr:MAG: hypothetical protein BYD32DRAFT_416627 [Podila humilis]